MNSRNYFDTVIIGSGIAGLNFALNAAKQGTVLIITKKRTIESSTNRAQGGIAAVLDKTDNIVQHVQDTLEAGAYHNNKKAVEFMVKHSAEAIEHLIEMGVPFATDETGKLVLTREGGHRKRRIAFVGDYTGAAIEKTLARKVEQHSEITIWEHAFAVNLLVKENTCYGVEIIKNETVEQVFGGRLILATGGAGQVYRYTTNPSISTGDGLAMGIRAGLPTRDLEFIQFHPTALKVGGRTKFLISEAVRGEGAHLVNAKGERFMLKKTPQGELASRDIVARHVYEEDLHGGTFLDIRHEPAGTLKIRFPKIYQRLLQYGIDLTQDLVPIAPAAHYLCGGLVTNRFGETPLQNLYAFGEVAWTGVHGANRLASNSLLEALVFSNQILQKPHRRLTTIPSFKKARYEPLTPRAKRRLQSIQKEMRSILWEKVGIIRTQKGLKEAQEGLQKLEEKLTPLQGMNTLSKETENMLVVAKAITQAASKRKKSLGSHFLQN